MNIWLLRIFLFYNATNQQLVSANRHGSFYEIICRSYKLRPTVIWIVAHDMVKAPESSKLSWFHDIFFASKWFPYCQLMTVFKLYYSIFCIVGNSKRPMFIKSKTIRSGQLIHIIPSSKFLSTSIFGFTYFLTSPMIFYLYMVIFYAQQIGCTWHHQAIRELGSRPHKMTNWHTSFWYQVRSTSVIYAFLSYTCNSAATDDNLHSTTGQNSQSQK